MISQLIKYESTLKKCEVANRINKDRALTPEEVEKIFKQLEDGINARNQKLFRWHIEGRYLQQEDLEELLFGVGVNSYNRMVFFYDLIKYWKFKIEPIAYWKCLGLAYQSSDNLYEHRKKVRWLFLSEKPERNSLMDNEEQKFIATLPDEITIYRAMSVKEFKSKKYGISWTLSLAVANFFKERYTRNHSTNKFEKIIVDKTINKDKIVAYFGGRRESEVIYISPHTINEEFNWFIKNNQKE